MSEKGLLWIIVIELVVLIAMLRQAFMQAAATATQVQSELQQASATPGGKLVGSIFGL